MSPRPAKAVRGQDGGDPAAALRRLLIDTTERLLAERQAVGLTTREIARAAGVSDGVLYNYFTDKNELILTALVRRYGRLITRFDTGLPRPGDATVEDNLLACAEAALKMHLEGLPIVAGLLPDPALLHRFIDQLHRLPEGPQLFQHRITEYLQGEQRLGRLPAVDLSAATTLFTGAIMMLALITVTGVTTMPDPGRQLPGIVTTLLNGLSARP